MPLDRCNSVPPTESPFAQRENCSRSAIRYLYTSSWNVSPHSAPFVIAPHALLSRTRGLVATRHIKHEFAPPSGPTLSSNPNSAGAAPVLARTSRTCSVTARPPATWRAPETRTRPAEARGPCRCTSTAAPAPPTSRREPGTSAASRTTGSTGRCP